MFNVIFRIITSNKVDFSVFFCLVGCLDKMPVDSLSVFVHNKLYLPVAVKGMILEEDNLNDGYPVSANNTGGKTGLNAFCFQSS